MLATLRRTASFVRPMTQSTFLIQRAFTNHPTSTESNMNDNKTVPTATNNGVLYYGKRGWNKYQTWNQKTNFGSLLGVGGILLAISAWRLNKGRISEKEARDRLGTCIMDQFTESKPIEAPKGMIDHKSTPSAAIISTYLTPTTNKDCFYLLTGSTNIGKSTLVQSVYNAIKQNDPSAPIIYVNMEDGLDAFAKAINAFPAEITAENEEAAFHKAYGRLNQSLDANAKSIYDEKGKIPVLVIDAMQGIPMPLFKTMALSLKRVCSAGLLKVVLLASNGYEGHRYIQNRIIAKHRIENDFDEDDIKKYLQNKGKNIDIYSAKLLTEITGGRIGYVKVLIDGISESEMTQCKQEKEQDTNKEIQKLMIHYLYNSHFRGIIVGALHALNRIHTSSDDIKQLIDPDLASKIKTAQVLEILEYHNIVDEDGYECKPLEMIFKDNDLRNDIQAKAKQKKWIE